MILYSSLNVDFFEKETRLFIDEMKRGKKEKKHQENNNLELYIFLKENAANRGKQCPN